MKEGGLAASILEYACDQHLSMKLERMGIGDHYVGHGDTTRLKADEAIDLNSLYQKIQRYVEKSEEKHA